VQWRHINYDRSHLKKAEDLYLLALSVASKCNSDIAKMKPLGGLAQVEWCHGNTQVVQKPLKPHTASRGFSALCKAARRISIFRTHKPAINDSHEYRFECSIHAAIKSDPANTMIYP
jgi:hypothetical protein